MCPITQVLFLRQLGVYILTTCEFSLIDFLDVFVLYLRLGTLISSHGTVP